MRQLEEQLQEEAENVGVIDFPEFAAAISNMGIRFSKSKLKRIFSYFLAEQQLEYTQRGVEEQDNHRYEVKLKWMIKYLQSKVDNFEHLKPKQILQLAFMELLEDQSLNQRVSFMNLKASTTNSAHSGKANEESKSKSEGSTHSDLSEGNESVQINEDKEGDDGFVVNEGDFDMEITRHRSVEDEQPKENVKKVTINGKAKISKMNESKSHLIRQQSEWKWSEEDVNRQRQEMQNMMEQMHNQQRASQLHNEQRASQMHVLSNSGDHLSQYQ